MGKTNFCFTPGKLTTIMDGQAGSSGKGCIGSFVCQHADNWQFACNTFMPQAGHWVKLDDGRNFFYQTLNSCAYQHDKYEKMYIGPGATIELPALFKELEDNGVPRHKLGISPITSILQDIDTGYERGTHDFSGFPFGVEYGTNHITEAIKAEHVNGRITISGKLRHCPIPGTAVVNVRIGAGNLRMALSASKPEVDLPQESGWAWVTYSFDAGNLITIVLKDISPTGPGRVLNDLSATIDYEYSCGNIAGGPLAATGSTAHGCGANRARRVLRRKEAKYARDIPELKEFLCDVPREIMARLDKGQAGLLEVAQGFQLSYMLQDMFPYTTSRNCTVAAGLDDMMVAPKYAGNVILNFRTYPIRINSNKYIDAKTGQHLTTMEVAERLVVDNDDDKAELAKNGIPMAISLIDHNSDKHLSDKYGVTVVRGNSGPGYSDQEEISWSDLTRSSGSPQFLVEITSVTKLPRRVFTFSKQNLNDAIMHNDTGHNVYLSLNFANYVDHKMAGVRSDQATLDTDKFTTPLQQWLNANMLEHIDKLRFVGTGALTDDKIVLEGDDRLPPVGVANK